MSSTEARRFGLGGFALLGAVALWLWLRKHHPVAAAAVGSAGGLLLALSLAAPQAALAVRSAWMGLARIIGRVNGTVLLVVIFFLVLTPVALVRRLFRTRHTGWEPHEKRTPEHFEDPY